MQDTVLANRYRLVAKLGAGAMGSVWQAEDLTLHRQVAIKLIKPAYAESSEAMGRFQLEARAAARLRSTHIITIHDYGIDDKTPFIVMELLEGESLSARLSREGSLTPKSTAHVLSQVAEALCVAHENGVIHRDLKPDNIFIVRERNKEVVKVLDFGIAKTVDGLASNRGGLTGAGELLGTPYYMSPEQMLGQKDVNQGLDIWALGIIAYECLVGEPPLQGQTVGAILNAICSAPLPIPSSHAKVPNGFDEWFGRAAARDTTKRFATADEATNALGAICGSTDDIASDTIVSSSDVEASWRSSERPRKRLTITLSLALVALAGLVVFRIMPHRGDLVVVVAGPTEEQVDNVQIFIDGQKQCDTSPCVMQSLVSGRAHFIKVRAPGYANPADLPITIKPGEDAHVRVQLTPAAGTARLKVMTETSGLTLWLDGKEIGPLPQEIKDVSAGEHDVKVGGNGRYETFSEKITLSDNERKAIGPLQLKVLHGLAAIELGDNADGTKVTVVSGGQRCELTRLPTTVDIPTDEAWELIALKRGYPEYEVPLTFDRGKAERTFRIDLHRPNESTTPFAAVGPETPATSVPTLESPAVESSPVTASLVPASARAAPPQDAGIAIAQSTTNAKGEQASDQGTLNVNCIPVANVLVDGRPLGSTPKLGIKVPAGKHTVVFVHPEYGRKEVTIDVAAGGTTTAAVRFP